MVALDPGVSALGCQLAETEAKDWACPVITSGKVTMVPSVHSLNVENKSRTEMIKIDHSPDYIKKKFAITGLQMRTSISKPSYFLLLQGLILQF